MLLVLAFVGCGDVQELHKEAATVAASPGRAAFDRAALKTAGPSQDKLLGNRVGEQEASTAPAAAQPGAAPAPAGAPAISRKIIYDAQIDLVVEKVDPVAKKVTTFIQQAGGFVAELNVTGSPGSLRSMRWRFRVPVERFESFVDAVLTLGELERNNRTSQDVTEQYYDIEARIKNKQVEEQTLTKILQERSGKLEDVLKIEVELSRVRGEIEQLQGKIRVLENLSSLATLTLNVREREKYEPPPPVVADFPTQVARTWSASLLGVVNLGKAVVLWAVSWALWVPILLVVGYLAWVLLRWLFRAFVRMRPALVELARTPITPPRSSGSGT
jgi:hypothetical protein